MLNLIEDLSEVSEAIREENIVGALEHLPHVFAWLCSSCSLEGIRLQDSVWRKYPARCPYCKAERNCVCIGRISRLKKDKRPTEIGMRKYIEQRSKEPHPLQSWFEMFKRIYGNVNAVVRTKGGYSQGRLEFQAHPQFCFRCSLEGVPERVHDLCEREANCNSLQLSEGGNVDKKRQTTSATTSRTQTMTILASCS
jgi:hypothetical protein